MDAVRRKATALQPRFHIMLVSTAGMYCLCSGVIGRGATSPPSSPASMACWWVTLRPR